MHLLGRNAELAACQTALWEQPPPGAVGIVGGAGIGKTALYRTLVERARQSQWLVFSTVGLPGEVDVPLANFSDLFDPGFRGVLDELPDEQADTLRAALRLHPAGRMGSRALLARATVNAIRAFGDRPVLIAVDDAQWLDADTRRLLKVAISWSHDAKIFWLAAERHGLHADRFCDVLSHHFGNRMLQINLSDLSEDILVRLILDQHPAAWAPGILRRIAELADGNAYTALELARETMAAGAASGPAIRLRSGAGSSGISPAW